MVRRLRSSGTYFGVTWPLLKPTDSSPLTGRSRTWPNEAATW